MKQVENNYYDHDFKEALDEYKFIKEVVQEKPEIRSYINEENKQFMNDYDDHEHQIIVIVKEFT